MGMDKYTYVGPYIQCVVMGDFDILNITQDESLYEVKMNTPHVNHVLLPNRNGYDFCPSYDPACNQIDVRQIVDKTSKFEKAFNVEITKLAKLSKCINIIFGVVTYYA